MTTVSLNRLAITGPITNETPLVVIVEIAHAHGLRFSENRISDPHYLLSLTESIERLDPLSITTSDINYRNIARFINKDRTWNSEDLMTAYSFLCSFFTPSGVFLNQSLLNNGFGSQTPDNLFSLNSCVLYSLCRKNRITTNRSTTTEQMAHGLQLLLLSPEDLSKLVSLLPKEALVSSIMHNFLLQSQQKEEKIDVVPYQQLSLSLNMINSRSYLLLSHKPTSVSEAIILASLNYHADISDNSDPLRAYQRIHQNKSCEPIIDLRKHFNPRLPEGCYHPGDLVQLAKFEGYNSRDIESIQPYELLTVAYYSTTFHQGSQPNTTNKETPFLGDIIGDLSNESLISFGSKDGKMITASIEELVQYYSRRKTFENPFYPDIGDKSLSPLQINKFKNILLDNPTEEKRSLLSLLYTIEIYIQGCDQETTAMVDKCKDTILRGTVLSTLQSLLELGMYMRGWTDYSPFPVSTLPDTTEEVTYANTSKALVALLKSDHFSLISNLPLLVWKEGKWIRSPNAETGLTIGERLTIIKSDYENVNSCIRISSNWLVSTAYYYLKLLGVPPSFNIEELRYIS